MAWLDKVRKSFLFWLARRLPACKEVTEMISASMDQKLLLHQRIKLRLHLAICLWCQRYQDQLYFLREALQSYPIETEEANSSAQPSLSPEARERIKRTLTQG